MIMLGSVKLVDGLLSDWITPLLKEKGFRRMGMSYEQDTREAIAVVGYQRSVSRGDCEKFTVNLGIGSKRIFAFEDQRTSKRTPIELCHWRMRLGRTLDEPADTWWELCGPADLPVVGREQQELLRAKALPLLNRMTSDDALRAEWREQRAPGLTELQRLLNLSVLLNDSEHREEQHAVIGKLKSLARGKAFAGTVAVHLEELGVE
jgi:hypothetical protein